jgi:hypothetical protein
MEQTRGPRISLLARDDACWGGEEAFVLSGADENRESGEGESLEDGELIEVDDGERRNGRRHLRDARPPSNATWPPLNNHHVH